MANYSIWPATNGPSTDDSDPNNPINLGHIFQVSSICWIIKIRFWRGTTNVQGSPEGRVFSGVAGAKISGTETTFTLSGTGWQESSLAAPVQLAANTTYKVVVHFPNNYTGTGGYWNSGAGVGGITNGPLIAPDAGGVPLSLGGIQQGSFKYSVSPDVNPDQYFNGGNYWIDLVVTDTDPSAGAQANLLNVPSTIYSPSISQIIITNSLSVPTAIYNPAVESLLKLLTIPLLSVPSAIYNPLVSGGVVMAVGTISDKARDNMIADRVLSEPVKLTNPDLMKLVLDDPSQVLVTKTLASAGNQLVRYMMGLR